MCTKYEECNACTRYIYPGLEKRDNYCLSRNTPWRGYDQKCELMTKIAAQKISPEKKVFDPLRDVIRLFLSPNLAGNAGIDGDCKYVLNHRSSELSMMNRTNLLVNSLTPSM